MPKMPVSTETSLPDSWRNKCSASCEMPPAGAAVGPAASGMHWLRGGRPESVRERAFRGDRAHLDHAAMLECRASLRDGHRFFLARHADEEIAANGFLRLGEGTVHDDAALSTGDELAFGVERIGALHFALFLESLEPAHEAPEGAFEL